MRSKPDLSGL
jgi:hypothetical protein